MGNKELCYVFVVTYGRSGSTLLQNVLNAHEGVLIRGENDGVFLDLFNIHRKSVENLSKRRRYAHAVQNAWYGFHEVSEERLLKSANDFFVNNFLSPQGDEKILGFKEIRNPDEYDELSEYLHYLRACFEGARIIFNVRDPIATSQSGWWPYQKGSLQRIQTRRRSFETFHREHPDFTFIADYDLYCADHSKLGPLFDFLGMQMNPDAVETAFETRYAILAKSNLARGA